MTSPTFAQANLDLNNAVTDLEGQNAALKAQLALSVEARDDAALLLAAEAIEVHVTNIRAALSALQGPVTAVVLGGEAAKVGEVVNVGDLPVTVQVPAVGATVEGVAPVVLPAAEPVVPVEVAVPPVVAPVEPPVVVPVAEPAPAPTPAPEPTPTPAPEPTPAPSAPAPGAPQPASAPLNP